MHSQPLSSVIPVMYRIISCNVQEIILIKTARQTDSTQLGPSRLCLPEKPLS